MAVSLKEILNIDDLPLPAAQARLLSVLYDKADNSMILQLEADELIPYPVLFEAGEAVKKHLGVPSVRIYPKYATELFEPSYIHDIVQILKSSHGVINGYMDDAQISDDGDTYEFTLMHGGLELLYSQKIDKEIEKFIKGVFSKSVSVRFSENASVDYEELDRRYFEELSAQPLPDFDAIDRRAAERAEEGKSSRGRK